MKHVKKFKVNEAWEKGEPIENMYKSEEKPFSHTDLFDGVLEDIDRALKMNNVNDIKRLLSSTYNMIINDMKYIK